MGCGKSTVGKKLAFKLNRPFYDLDDLIEKKEGCPIEVIFARKGESYFRNVESDMLRNSEMTSCIVATGGGTPCFNQNMDWMNLNGLTVYLEGSATFLASRLQGQVTRPLLAGIKGDKLLETIEKLLDERQVFYNQSKIIVRAKDIDIASLSNKIIQEMRL